MNEFMMANYGVVYSHDHKGGLKNSTLSDHLELVRSTLSLKKW